jgi:hypothetical protein
VSQQTPRPNPQSSLGTAVMLLYIGGILGIVSAVVSATQLDAPNALRFVLAAISVILTAICFAVGIFIDVQR